MRSVPFRTVLENVLAISGNVYDSASTTQLNLAAHFINNRMQEGWEWGPWPEWTRVEERAFAQMWNATVEYSVGDVVFNATDSKYYVALTVSAGAAPESSGSDWEETTDVDPLVSYEQENEEAIGRVFDVTSADPRYSTRWIRKDWMLTENGVAIPDETGKTVWVTFLRRAPRFTARVWSSSQAYSRYDLVYYPGTDDADVFPQRGEVYEAELDTNGDQMWEKIPFPAELLPFVAAAAGADMLRHYGSKEQASEYEGRAYEYLKNRFDLAGVAVQARVRVTG